MVNRDDLRKRAAAAGIWSEVPISYAREAAIDLPVEDEKVGIVAGSGFYLGESCSS
jgi:hypothetical protein